MIIRFILLSMLFFLLLYAISQRSKSKPLAYFMAFCSFIGMIFVVHPELTSKIATYLGIGRGADLVFYVVSLAGIAVVFNLHLRLRSYAEDISELTRSLAILSAKPPQKRS
jgi:hypothetical protein